MNEPNEDITDQPQGVPPRRNGSTGPGRQENAYEPEGGQPPPPKSRVLPYLLLASGIVGLVLCCPLMGVGILIPAVAKVREAAARTQSMNNVKQMGLAVNNVASMTATGEIPPSYGDFPSVNPRSGSYFYHLLPYIEYGHLYNSPSDLPVKTYITQTDTRNPGINATISYCSNGTLLSGKPHFPTSFGGRTSSIICVMERSGMDGAHKWTTRNSYLGAPGSPPPFPEIGIDPGKYADGSPQGFTSAGCIVGFGDGSARLITNNENTSWKSFCDPNGPPPLGW